MIAYKGRHKLKIYMPKKPIKFGFKVYMLCDCETGITINFYFHNEIAI